MSSYFHCRSTPSSMASHWTCTHVTGVQDPSSQAKAVKVMESPPLFLVLQVTLLYVILSVACMGLIHSFNLDLEFTCIT